MSFRTAYGYTISENGWRMCNRDECVIAPVQLEYIDTAPLRRGDVATILGAWMVWYDRNVEEILSPVWGWSNTNDVGNSNHLSGTAIDVNAPRYPWGLRTMPQARINKIRQGLALFEGSVFWGADWGRADEMHYQIGYPEGDWRLAGFAQKLRSGHLGIYGSPTPAPKEDAPMSAAEVQDLKKYIDDRITFPIGSDVKDLREQHCGEGARDAGEYTGWTQLGDRTIVDALAVIGAHLNIPGFIDPKAGK